VRWLLGEKYAKAYNVPAHQVSVDMAQNPAIMARFGQANVKEFARATARARAFGMSIKDVNAAFGDQLDTFEGSAKASAHLNAAFGTTINSLDLMLETNPEKRMEMVSKQLKNQGLAYDKLNVFQKNAIKSTFGIDDAQAQLAFGSKDVVAKLNAQEKAKKAQLAADEKWNAKMGDIKQTLISWEADLQKLGLAITNFIGKLLGFESADKGIQDFARQYSTFYGADDK
jgi:hypothetical protein